MRINVTVPNWSPALSYTPQLLWSEGNETDASLDLYKFGYHSTTLNGPSMVFNFNGTGVWIFGGFRPSLGPYNVKLDNSTFSNPGFGAGDSESFQAVLFGKGDMDCAPHQLILYNNAAPNNSQAVLDVDYLVYETEIGDEASPATQSLLQPTQFEYLPSNEYWQNNSLSISTQSPLGCVAIPFNGESIQVSGGVGLNHSSFYTSLDGIVSRSYISNTQRNNSGLIYTASGLPQGNHTLRMCNDPDELSQVFAIESAVVYSTPGPTIMNAMNAASQNSLSISKNAETILLLGSTIGAIGLLSIALAGFLFFRIRKSHEDEKLVDIGGSKSPHLLRTEFSITQGYQLSNPNIRSIMPGPVSYETAREQNLIARPFILEPAQISSSHSQVQQETFVRSEKQAIRSQRQYSERSITRDGTHVERSTPSVLGPRSYLPPEGVMTQGAESLSGPPGYTES